MKESEIAARLAPLFGNSLLGPRSETARTLCGVPLVQLAEALGVIVEPDDKPIKFSVNGNDWLLAWYKNGDIEAVAKVQRSSRNDFAIDALVKAYGSSF